MNHYLYPQKAARSLRRRSLLGLLGAAPLTAAAVPAARAMAGTGTGSAGVGVGQDQCGPPPADLLPGGAYDQRLTAMAASDQFSGTVLLAYQGRPVLTRALGWADKERSIPNQTGTLFNLESVTKVFTGVAVAQLAAQGKIDFHATLGSYLDKFPAQVADTVTVHQLLTHTAGMGDYTQTPAFASERQTWNSAAEVFGGIMGIIRTMPLAFTPGTRYQYSNSGFYVLGAIVAQVSGQSYYDYMRQYVFAPAGMTRTGFYTQPQMLANRDIAHPYATRDGQHVDVASEGTFIGGPDHGAYSSGPELLAFSRALQSGKLLTPAYAELALSGKYPVAQATGEPAAQSISIGYGVENLIVNNQRVFGHPGGSQGANTDLNIYPGVGWVAAVLGNYNFDVASLLQLQNQLVTQQSSCASDEDE
jgi:CubicO group peptidase (beta-lactamase class C family)